MEAGGHLPRSFSGQEPSQAMGELMKGGGSGQGRGADCTVSQQAGPSLPP